MLGLPSRSHPCQASSAVTPVVSKSFNPDSDRRRYFVGVEISPAIIRAGVFSESMRLIGKTKFSTKGERGPQAVMERVARCVAYAADECDLALDQIRAVGVGVPGCVDSRAGMVRVAPELSWQEVPLQGELMKLLSVPVLIENIHQLGALGIYAHELNPKPNTFLAIFLGSQITGGVLHEGRLSALNASLPLDHGLEAPERNVLAVLPHPLFENFRSRDFRKSLRKGNPAVRHYLLAMAERAAGIIAQLAETLAPDTIALGGGVMDEMKEEILQVIHRPSDEAAFSWMGKLTLLSSSLGDLAGITGAATWVADGGRSRPTSAACSLSPA